MPNKALFQVMRRGFANERLRIEIKGMGTLTVNPQFVHRDEGRGLCIMGTVANGSTLTIDEEGRFFINGAPADDRAFTWEGGCFGDSANPSPRDWCFDGPHLPLGAQAAKYATTKPPGVFQGTVSFPHAPVDLDGVGITIGLNRFAFFVAGNTGESQVADITLSWIEREPYALKVWVPRRFEGLAPAATDPNQPLPMLARALERFRAMGVEIKPTSEDSAWSSVVAAMVTPAP